MEAQAKHFVTDEPSSSTVVFRAVPARFSLPSYKGGRPSKATVDAEKWLIEMLSMMGPQADIDVLSQTMRLIDAFCVSANFSGIDRVFKRLKTVTVEPLARITLLRTTLPYRAQLKNWKPFRNHAYRTIARARRDVDKVMYDLVSD